MTLLELLNRIVDSKILATIEKKSLALIAGQIKPIADKDNKETKTGA